MKKTPSIYSDAITAMERHYHIERDFMAWISSTPALFNRALKDGIKSEMFVDDVCRCLFCVVEELPNRSNEFYLKWAVVLLKRLNFWTLGDDKQIQSMLKGELSDKTPAFWCPHNLATELKAIHKLILRANHLEHDARMLMARGASSQPLCESNLPGQRKRPVLRLKKVA